MTNPEYLLKLKQAGKTDSFIAMRLGITVVEVERMWKDIALAHETIVNNGYPMLSQAWLDVCTRYNGLGEALKQVTLWLQSPLSAEDIRELISDDKEQTIQNIMNACLVMPPFRFIPPEGLPQNPKEEEVRKN